MKCSIDICKDVVNISNEFEINNTELKKRFLKKNIELYNRIAQSLDTYRGSFGTGYPFYALQGGGLHGRLPIIAEQIRYNRRFQFSTT